MTNVIKKLGLAALLAAIPVHANAQPKQLPKSPSKAPTHMTSQKAKPSYDSKFDIKKIEWGVAVGYDHLFSNPLKDWSELADTDFKNGRYTSTSPVPDWQGITVPSGMNLLEFEASAMYPVKNDLKAGLVVGYKKGSTKTSYSSNHIVNGINTKITRKEEIDYTAPYVGLKGEKVLINDKLSATIGANLEFAKIDGTSDWAIHRMDNSYTKWYNSTFKGSKTIPSVELSLVGKVLRWLSLDASIGKKFGKIKSKGNVTTTFSTSNNSVVGEYSPKLDLESFYVSGSLTARF